MSLTDTSHFLLSLNKLSLKGEIDVDVTTLLQKLAATDTENKRSLI